jgi:Bax protein
LRAEAHAEGERLSPELMTTGLDRYSERGQAYVDEVQAMIHNNRLQWLVVGAQLVRDSGRLAGQ